MDFAFPLAFSKIAYALAVFASELFTFLPANSFLPFPFPQSSPANILEFA